MVGPLKTGGDGLRGKVSDGRLGLLGMGSIFQPIGKSLRFRALGRVCTLGTCSLAFWVGMGPLSGTWAQEAGVEPRRVEGGLSVGG